MPCCRSSTISFLSYESLRSNAACAASPRAAAAMGEATHTSRAALRPGDSQDREKTSVPTDIFLRNLFPLMNLKYMFFEFPLFVYSMSLNIDMKMIRSSNSSGRV